MNVRPGFCVRTVDTRDRRLVPPSGTKHAADTDTTLATAAAGCRVYVNFCQHECIPPPRTPDGKPAASHVPPQFLLIPLSIGPPRRMYAPAPVTREASLVSGT